MKKDFKKIALQLGLMVPACLLSIDSTAAENGTIATDEKSFSELEQNEIMNLLAMDTNAIISKEMPLINHSDRHTNYGSDHSDQHTNYKHSDYHANQDAYTRSGQCLPHSDSHTNSAPHSDSHTNSGRYGHTDNHTNVTPKTGC